MAVSCSFGVATLRPGDDPTRLVAEADAALYRAKRAGRDRYEVGGPRLVEPLALSG